MIVLHIESGLGNQMLGYCEYLALKKTNPGEDIFIENIVYDIPECNDQICQWNGYELGRIFGIHVPNVSSIIDKPKWDILMSEIRKSEFWDIEKHNWNWPVYFTDAFNKIGIPLKNIRGDFESQEVRKGNLRPNQLKYYIFHSRVYMYFKYYRDRKRYDTLLSKQNYIDELFYRVDNSILTGQKLLFKLRNAGIEQIEENIREAFRFPIIEDKINKEMASIIQSCQSVAVHARRGDMLGSNFFCYKNGYFRRSISFIKNKIKEPVFFIFCDEDSIDWAKKNQRVLGLDFKRDRAFFIDWNKGKDSYRDMQLMSMCKHQVITTSSFGWWAAWLNDYPNKITCSPDYHINTTHTF